MSTRISNPYLLLTPGPLSTSASVKETMLRDWCTWDRDYNDLVQEIRERLVKLATNSDEYTAVLMQGSGTFSVEAAIGTFIPEDGKVLILVNGAYGERLVKVAKVLKIDHKVIRNSEKEPPIPAIVDQILSEDISISHVSLVHCETTTGMLNPLHEISEVVRNRQRVLILDAMSSFGGLPIDVDRDKIDVLVSSANKCIEGVPGFGFVIAKRSLLRESSGNARSLALDLYDQWRTMEDQQGKWRFTSPTHTVRAFHQALVELEMEGGIPARYDRYVENYRILIKGMKKLGFECYLPEKYQSPIITSFLYPKEPDFMFKRFYENLRSLGFVIYPGKVTDADTFRIGNIGRVFPEDIKKLIKAIDKSIYWRKNEHQISSF